MQGFSHEITLSSREAGIAFTSSHCMSLIRLIILRYQTFALKIIYYSKVTQNVADLVFGFNLAISNNKSTVLDCTIISTDRIVK
jgi:hypothetical protein